MIKGRLKLYVSVVAVDGKQNRKNNPSEDRRTYETSKQHYRLTAITKESYTIL